jgi:myo-inositol-1(or 4)-monophosphatase
LTAPNQFASAGEHASDLALAIETARAAGDLLRSRQREILNVRHKGVVDLVTDADIASEKLVAEMLHSARPEDGLLAEEGTGEGVARSNGRCWIVDPLDGTTNYAHGYPLYAVSIALEVAGEVTVGVVYVPALDEMFAAAAGGGAWLNEEPIGVSTAGSLIEAMLCTGFAYNPDIRPLNYPHFVEFVERSQAVRRDGAAALDLAYVACGRYDGYWERELAPWDLAAGALLVREAGGQLSGFHGQPADIRAREIVATNGLLHEDMLEVLALNP